VQPVLEDSVRKLAGISLVVFNVHAEGRAGDGRVVEFTQVAALFRPQHLFMEHGPALHTPQVVFVVTPNNHEN
jgi:hypothetical protein